MFVGRRTNLEEHRVVYQSRECVLEYEAKCWPEFFEPICLGLKTHDLRRYGERSYQVGDVMVLREFDPRYQQYTGRIQRVEITYVTSADSPCALSRNGLDPGLCILSIRKVEPPPLP